MNFRFFSRFFKHKMVDHLMFHHISSFDSFLDFSSPMVKDAQSLNQYTFDSFLDFSLSKSSNHIGSPLTFRTFDSFLDFSEVSDAVATCRDCANLSILF